MLNDAFTAGVVPGGLISHSDVKILICDILRTLNEPVSDGDLVGSLTDRGLANYFELNDAISELLSAGHLVPQDGSYVLSATGRQIAEMLADDLPATVRERGLGAVSRALEDSKKKRQNLAEIVKTETGYEVRCSIVDEAAGPLYGLTLYAPTRGAAEKIRDNFIDKAERLLRQDLSLLTGEQF